MSGPAAITALPVNAHGLSIRYGSNVVPFIPRGKHYIYCQYVPELIRFRASGGYSAMKISNKVYEGFPVEPRGFLCLRKIESSADETNVMFEPPTETLWCVISPSPSVIHS